MIDPEPVAQIEFTVGELRPVFETSSGQQYVLDDDGNRVYGIWFIPPEECDCPVVVDERPF
jgi:hypothetical protein